MRGGDAGRYSGALGLADSSTDMARGEWGLELLYSSRFARVRVRDDG